MRWTRRTRSFARTCVEFTSRPRSSRPFVLIAMHEINPYKPSTVNEDLRAKGGIGRDLCPSCSRPMSRWTVWNKITSKRCGNCGDKLWLELTNPFRLVLVLIGIGICGFWWRFFDSPSVTPVFMVAGMPFLMAGISCAMQLAFGKIRSTNQTT